MMNIKTLVSSAVRAYQKIGGNFVTRPTFPLKKERDLATFYYPGLDSVAKKIEEDPELQKKFCRYYKTVGLISPQPKSYYPILTAKAGLLSTIADVNVIPLLIRYEHFSNLPLLLDQTSLNFQVIFCSGFRPLERMVLEKIALEKKLPVLFQEQLEAAAVVAALLNVSRMLKKSSRKLHIVIEGTHAVQKDIIKQLREEGFDRITLVDERGQIYQRRPNMNKEKNVLASMVHAQKSNESREEILQSADAYICSTSDALSSSFTSKLSDRAVIIALRAASIEKQSKQSLVSSLPTLPNHLTDLHIAVGITAALSEGKKLKADILSRARKALAAFYSHPKSDRLIPGLLEKNLGKKLAKKIH